MAGGYTEKDIEKFIQSSKDRKLSTRHRKFVNSFSTTEEELIRNISEQLESAPSDLAWLELEITKEMPEERKAIVEKELGRAKSLVADSQLKQHHNQPTNVLDSIMQSLSSLFSSR
jgi:hypothetical protein